MLAFVDENPLTTRPRPREVKLEKIPGAGGLHLNVSPAGGTGQQCGAVR